MNDLWNGTCCKTHIHKNKIGMCVGMPLFVFSGFGRSPDGHQFRNDRLDHYLLFMLTYVETQTEVCSQCEFRSEYSTYWEMRQ